MQNTINKGKSISRKQLVDLAYRIVRQELKNSGATASVPRDYQNYHLEKKVSTIFKRVLNRPPFKRKNTPFSKHAEYRENLLAIMKNNEPLMVTIIAFPKKVPNILKTNGLVNFQLGDYYVLAKLEVFARTLEKYYKPVKVLITPEASFFHKLVEGYSYFDKTEVPCEKVAKYNSELERAIKDFPHLAIYKHLKEAVDESMAVVKPRFDQLWQKNRRAYEALRDKAGDLSALTPEEKKAYRELLRGIKIFIVLTSLTNVLGRELSARQANILYAYLIQEFTSSLEPSDRETFYRRVMEILKIPSRYLGNKGLYYAGIEEDAKRLWERAAMQIYEYQNMQEAKYLAKYKPEGHQLYLAITNGKRLCFDIGIPFPNHGVSTIVGNCYFTKVYNEMADKMEQFDQMNLKGEVAFYRYRPKLANLVTDIDGVLYFKGDKNLDQRLAESLEVLGKKTNLVVASGRSPLEVKQIFGDFGAPFKAVLENGARVFNFKNWENDFYLPVPRDLKEGVFSKLSRDLTSIKFVAYWTEDAKRVIFYVPNERERPMYQEKYRHLNSLFISEAKEWEEDYFTRDQCQIMIIPRETSLIAGYRWLGVTYSAENININHPEVSKLKGVQRYLRDGHTIVMVDGENDVPLTEVENKFLVVVKNKETPKILLEKADCVFKRKEEVVSFLQSID